MLLLMGVAALEDLQMRQWILQWSYSDEQACVDASRPVKSADSVCDRPGTGFPDCLAGVAPAGCGRREPSHADSPVIVVLQKGTEAVVHACRPYPHLQT